MPTIRQSAQVDTSRLQPAEPGNTLRITPNNLVTSIVPPDTSQVSPFMQGSLPSVASGADVYVRQFYRGGPRQRRFMPIAL